jgi:hypothetical protein
MDQGNTVTVHLTERAFLLKRLTAWPALSISRSRIALRLVVGRLLATRWANLPCVHSVIC